jgi:hypothetical protein
VLVRTLRFPIVLLHEQRLAAAELCFVEMRRRGVLRDQAVERHERVVDAPLGFVRSRELIQHEVVLGVVRVGREQLFVHVDRAAQVAQRLDVARQLLDVGGLELQVREASHGFGFQQRIVGRDVEEQPIAFHGFRFAADDRSGGIDLDACALEVLDRAGRLDGPVAIAAEGPDRGDRQQHDQRGAGHSPAPASAAARVAPAGAPLAAARSYIEASAKRACTM